VRAAESAIALLAFTAYMMELPTFKAGRS